MIPFTSLLFRQSARLVCDFSVKIVAQKVVSTVSSTPPSMPPKRKAAAAAKIAAAKEVDVQDKGSDNEEKNSGENAEPLKPVKMKKMTAKRQNNVDVDVNVKKVDARKMRTKKNAEQEPAAASSEEIPVVVAKRTGGRNNRDLKKLKVLSESDEDQPPAESATKVKNKTNGRKKKPNLGAESKDDKPESSSNDKELISPETKVNPKKTLKSKKVVAKSQPDKVVRGKKKTSEEKPEKDVAVKNSDLKVQKEEEKSKTVISSNQTETKWDQISFSCAKSNREGKKSNTHISCWNLGGLRAWVKKGCLAIMEQDDQPDIFCVQETKCSEDMLPNEALNIGMYKAYWCDSAKNGYAGVGLYTKIKPIDVSYGIDNETHDNEGRCITAEFDDFYVVNVYVPNAGRQLKTLDKRLDWNSAFSAYIKKLDAKKPVILCGDMNVAHSEIDLTNPKTNTKNAGFTPEERAGMTDFLQQGFVDVFRELYPDQKGAYTFWSYMGKARSKNIGWRLDYFIVSKRLVPKVCDTVIYNQIYGSDHCPISLYFHSN